MPQAKKPASRPTRSRTASAGSRSRATSRTRAATPTRASTRSRAASASRSRAASAASFREPAALKRLMKSLESAQDALGTLRTETGRDVGAGARNLYKDVRTFLTRASRDTGKLTKALQSDFERAQKKLTRRTTTGRRAPARSATARTRRASASSRRSSSRGLARRGSS